MRRNLFIIVGIFLGILALMVTGNIIIIGEKLGAVTHLWWTEYVFYGLLLLITIYYIVWPFVRIHRAPQFPVLSVQDELTAVQLNDLGQQLVKHCDYISADNEHPDDEHRLNLRAEHQQQLRQKLADAMDDATRLKKIIKEELELRFKGSRELGVLGINQRIREWAKSVFMITAISQNSRFDTISVMYLNLRMISDVISASGFRPTNRQLFRMYASILTTALITYAVSEALTISGSVAPFDFGDLDTASDAVGDDVMDVDADNVEFNEMVDDPEGMSLYSILRRIRIPGVVVSAALDGTVNALMTLRLGYITRAYLQQGSKALSGIQNKRAVKRQAMKDAFVNVPAVIAAGSSVIGKRTSQFLIKFVQKEGRSGSLIKTWKEKLRNLF